MAAMLCLSMYVELLFKAVTYAGLSQYCFYWYQGCLLSQALHQLQARTLLRRGGGKENWSWNLETKSINVKSLKLVHYLSALTIAILVKASPSSSPFLSFFLGAILPLLLPFQKCRLMLPQHVASIVSLSPNVETRCCCARGRCTQPFRHLLKDRSLGLTVLCFIV